MLASPLAPLLPSGDPLFDGLPAPAVVLDRLPSAVGDGAVLMGDGESVGTLVVRDHALAGAVWTEPGRRLTGEAALARMRDRPGATVSAARLDRSVVDTLLPFLLSGEVLYGDLRLGWTDWHQLLADLRHRGGRFLAQLVTPAGSGATVIVDGEHRATYVDGGSDVGDESLLDGLSSHPGGAVTVFHMAATVAAAEEAPLRALLPSLKLVARDRLHQSSPRIERLLDAAAEDARPLDDVLADIRGMAIRGVMQSTLAGVAEDMRALVASRVA